MGNGAAVDKFKASLRGDLIRPGDPGYEAARMVYNGMIDRRPKLIARCADAADVIASVRFAGESGIRTAIRGGGHNAGGLGICDDGLVIDLSMMKGVRVEPRSRTVHVEGGCTWGGVDHATHAFGLATPAGILSTTGVGGLTLGGGIGYLTRKCGLTIDNLAGVDMVMADGRFLTASAEENADLFWAVRGGGGNFGVVTSFAFRLHPVDTVHAGPTLWDLEDAPEVLRFYREFIAGAPEDINGFFMFLTVPPGPPFPESIHTRKMCGIVWCYAGPPDRFEETFKPVRRFRKPVFEFVGPMPYPALQSMFDGLYPPGLQWYWKADFINELSDEAIRLHMKHGPGMPTPLSSMHLYPINGAARRVGKDATPWSYRDATWAEVIVGVDPDPANNDRTVRWANAYWNALHPHSAGGAYVNFMMDDEGQDRIKATYRDNYERLAAVKATFDPGNFFRVNQNILPSKGGLSSMNTTDRIEEKIFLRVPLPRVWRALTDAGEFGAWFGVKLAGAFAPGAAVKGKITEKGYEGFQFEIDVERIEPQRLFSWHWHPYAADPDADYSAETPTLVVCGLEEVAGGTDLTVVESGFDRLPAARRAEAYREHVEGWAGQMKAIERYLTKAA